MVEVEKSFLDNKKNIGAESQIKCGRFKIDGSFFLRRD